MKKHNRYQDYVIKDGQLVGEFEEMYRDYDDPWEQSERERYASEKAVATNLIEAFKRCNVIEFGCGFGQLTERIRKICPKTTGVDISKTAIKKAQKRYPDGDFLVGKFGDLDLLRTIKPDCIVMAEITWYILDDLDKFLDFLKTEMPNTLLIHLLMTYRKGEQKYGADKFTSLSEIKDYFGMNYIESGVIESPSMNGGARTYFAGSYGSI
jgi:predicted TPR repeat methyltransferase